MHFENEILENDFFDNEELIEETYHSRYMEPGIHERYMKDQKHINKKLRTEKTLNGSFTASRPVYNNRNEYSKNKITHHSKKDREWKKFHASLQTMRDKIYEKMDLMDYYTAGPKYI